MRLFVDHRTEYRYSEPQARVIQLLRVTPCSHEGQSVVDWRIDVDCDARLKRRRDGFGNEIAMLYVAGPVERIGLSVSGEVLTDDRAGMVRCSIEPLPPLFYHQGSPLTAPCPALSAFARDIGEGSRDPLERMHRLSHALFERIAFGPPHYDADRTAETAFAAGNGVCQDFAHMMIAGARVLGCPARYVSGHLYRPGAAEVSNSAHAWAEVHVDGYGWIGFDAANDMCPDEAYVRVAIGLDYRSAAPVSGQRVGGGRENLEVGVRVALTEPMQQTQGQRQA